MSEAVEEVLALAFLILMMIAVAALFYGIWSMLWAVGAALYQIIMALIGGCL